MMFATPSLFVALRGGAYFIIALFVIVSVIFVIFFYRETASYTLEETSEVFGDSSAGVGQMVIPNERRTTPATIVMHCYRLGGHLGRRGGMAEETNGVGTRMGMLGSVMESGVDASPVHSSSPRKPEEVRRESQGQSSSMKRDTSATTSQATLYSGSGSSMGDNV